MFSLTPPLSERHQPLSSTSSATLAPLVSPPALPTPAFTAQEPAPASSYAPDSPAAPNSYAMNPAKMRYAQLVKHFKPTKQLALSLEHGLLTEDMQRLHSRQPKFETFVQTQLEKAFPDVRPLDAHLLYFDRYRVGGDAQSPESSEPLMTALARMVKKILANPNALMRPERNIRTEFATRQTADEPGTPALTSSSLQSIARSIATQYPQALEEFWSTPEQAEGEPKLQLSPKDHLLILHKKQLSILAALRVADGTLSAQSKELIDNALRYPTLAAREKKFAHGARLGVYPVTVDNKTERGAMLAGAFLITHKDGSHGSPPTWPNGRTFTLNEANGPVVLYTPGEGFEEFATPAQARQALANRLDQGATDAQLLLQTLPPSLQNRPGSFTGEDLMRSVEPSSGDVLADAIPWMLKRQQAEIDTHLSKALAPADGINPLTDSASLQSIDDTADASYLLDGTNAMQARDAKLADKYQPEWLKNLNPLQEAFFTRLEEEQEKSLDKLTPLLEKIPSLPRFSRERMNAAIKQQYPNAHIDADKLMVQVRTRTGVQGGRGTGQPLYANQQSVSLTDLALKNPSGFPAVERGTFTDVKMTLPLVDTTGNPVLDLAGNPVTLGTDDLKKLVSVTDVGGEYVKLLKREMTTDAESGSAAQLRTAWKDSLKATQTKEAFLAELNPEAYAEPATEDTSTKRAAQWVDAVVEHPDPATRPQVDGKTIVANSLIHRGLAVQGVMVIGNQSDASLVLYTPKAPDGITFREVADHKSLDTLLAKGEWASYIAQRKSPVSKDQIDEFKDALKKRAYNPMKMIDPKLVISSVKLLGGALSLEPINANAQDHLYQQHVQMMIDRADHQSVSSAEVAEQSKLNKIEFGIEVALIFADLIPVAGKGISTGIRLGKAGVTALRANSRILPHLIKKPGLARAIYSDFTLAGSRIYNVRAAPMRPVFRASTTAGTLTPQAGSRALTAPVIPAAPALAGTSSGIASIGSHTPTTVALPSRDLSAFTVPSEIISGRPLRPDGTYNVDDNWYVRFTDSTGTNGVYQIDSVFHARSGQVNIVDPNAPLTAPRGSRIVASLQSAGNGEWRLNALRGGAPTQGAETPVKKALPETEYLSRNNGQLLEADFTPKSLPVARHWFRRDAQRFYHAMTAGGQMPPRPPRLDLAPNTSPAGLLKDAYQISDVVVLGESHNEIASFQLLKENMQTLKDAGVKAIYLENVQTNAAGQVVSAGMGSGRPPGASPTLLELTSLAQENGIAIRALDHRFLTRREDMPGFYRDIGDNDKGVTRLQEFNYYATRILQRRKPGEKVLALVGRAHMNTSRNVPGLAELSGGVGIGVYPATTYNKSIAISGPSIPKDPGRVVTGSHTAGDYQAFQKIT
ncbi:membrane-targeted effector domain-containing toxin [Pseudomonas fluorescens]|nr:membrane-targeted effector domain-containing toxin [Pseudomonas fluorescens]MBD8774667.1 membrane-targeted effector domain-containing toxin [Pseudomonas fluorescens]MBD8779873.1 membrane-targeted effector domain-containing toxin [Pseudomonas fluorescens]MBD8796880.1 membrane-targeted effector domain-containing toxin [Pseudomonas fluorescens]